MRKRRPADRRRFWKLLLLLLALTVGLALGTAGSAGASPALGDQPWGEFGFPTGPGAASACPSCVPSSAGNSFFLGDPPWEFTVADPVDLIVTDAFLAVDQFEVFDNQLLIGPTSLPSGNMADSCGSDPVVCLGDARFSHGIFPLGAGDHAITIVRTPVGASIAGAAYFCIDGPRDCVSRVSEPATLLLLGSGLAGLLGASLRRLSTRSAESTRRPRNTREGDPA